MIFSLALSIHGAYCAGLILGALLQRVRAVVTLIKHREMAEQPYFDVPYLSVSPCKEPDIYDEDEDAAVEIPFALASLTVHKPSNPSTPEKGPLSGDDGFYDLQLDQSPEYIGISNSFDLSGQASIESSPPLEHRMWKEAKTALRFCGTFSKLPLELQEVILDYCGPTTLLTWMQINPRTRFIAIQDRFWEKLYAADFPGAAPQSTEPDASWLQNYRMAHRHCVSARITTTVSTYSGWHYERPLLYVSGIPRRWQWIEKKNMILMPTFRSASWKPEANLLLFDSKSFFFDPSNGRFMSHDSPMTAQATLEASFPPVTKVNVWTRFGNLGQIIVTGTIPLPLLMCIIFRLE